jgi:putative transcriptional regulator
MERINFSRLVEDLDIPLDLKDQAQSHIGKTPIFRGGPVETERGFVLHSLDYKNPTGTLRFSGLADGFGLTAARDILVVIAKSKGPEKSLIALGYAGWMAGQLEQELSQNAWLTAPADPELVFGYDRANLWHKALSTLGIRPEHLSGQTGTA